MPSEIRHLSFGGHVVQLSLGAAGFNPQTAGASLVESARPTRRYESILLQNAWNVVSRAQFTQMLKPYPTRLRRRAAARRQVARFNLRHARRVVCLTSAVAAMLLEDMGIDSVVAPVTVPIHDWRDRLTSRAAHPPRALVPGTVTWYKQPRLALEWMVSAGMGVTHAVFCGKDDGSGCWQDVLRTSERLGLTVERMTVPHADLYSLYSTASVAILPSSLESLGFGLGEALLHAPRVVATPIAPHLEVAARTRLQPEWMQTTDGAVISDRLRGSRPITLAEATAQWTNAALALELQRI